MTHNLLRGIPEAKLEPEREKEIARELVSGTAKEKTAAKELLVLHAMWESFFYARRVCRQQLDDDEIFSLSYDALTRAVENFHAGSARFFAYAKVYVRGAICKAWKAKDVVKNSSSHESLCIEQDPYRDLSANPTVDVEYDSGIGNPKGDAREFNKRKLVEDSVEPELEKISLREEWAALQPLLRRLTAHEQLILKLKYEQEMNFQQMADLLGVSRSATQFTHKKAIAKLRRAFVK